MQPEDPSFTPDTIDEQIEHLRGTSFPASPAARLIADLQAQHLSESAAPATLAHAWARIQARTRAPDERPAPITTQQGVTTVTDHRPGTDTLPPPRALTPRSGRAEPPRRTWVGAIAAILIVVLGATIFALRPAPHTTGIGGAKATPTPTTPKPWAHVTQLDYDAPYIDSVPAIAPSNPNVVYEAYLTADGSATAYRRTDDGGKTWHALTLPVPEAGGKTYYRSFVSPFDPKTVFVQIYDGYGKNCPPGSKVPNSESGGSSCFYQYFSTDAGVHWQLEHLPLNGTFDYDIYNAQQNLRVQGQRLYMALGCNDFSCTRIITSTDSGKTWTLADAPIAASGQTLCDFNVTPQGATIVAFAAIDCRYTYKPSPLHLWQSDDAGATWHDMGTVPTPNLMGSAIIATHDPAQPLIYADLARVTSTTTGKDGSKTYIYSTAPSNIQVTADGGATWQAAPATGIPSSLGAAQLLMALPDGSILVEFDPTTHITDSQGTPTGIMYYTWRRGEASWHQFSAVATSGLVSASVTTPDAPEWHVWLTATAYRNLPRRSSFETMHVFKI